MTKFKVAFVDDGTVNLAALGALIGFAIIIGLACVKQIQLYCLDNNYTCICISNCRNECK